MSFYCNLKRGRKRKEKTILDKKVFAMYAENKMEPRVNLQGAKSFYSVSNMLRL